MRNKGHGWGFDHLTCPKGRVIDHWYCQIPTHPHPVPQGGIVGQTIDRCIMAADLQKCCSKDDLPAAPWRFLLSFISFLVLLYSFSKVRISPKVTIACYDFCLLRHTKTWLARDIISDIISYSGMMFSCVLYYFVNFEIIPLDK